LQLLDLHGRDSYLLCDVTKAHDYLWTLPLIQGYSEDVIEGRRELLDSIKERALLQEGRVKQDSKGIDVPVQLLPSALALLAQVRVCMTGWGVLAWCVDGGGLGSMGYACTGVCNNMHSLLALQASMLC
jgi:hypothetical protein